MYKPAPRADGNNLEFLELYNSNPWFHDISGYQIVCADNCNTRSRADRDPGRGVPGHRRLAAEHPECLWDHQRHGALYRQPEENPGRSSCWTSRAPCS